MTRITGPAVMTLHLKPARPPAPVHAIVRRVLCLDTKHSQQPWSCTDNKDQYWQNAQPHDCEVESRRMHGASEYDNPDQCPLANERDPECSMRLAEIEHEGSHDRKHSLNDQRGPKSGVVFG